MRTSNKKIILGIDPGLAITGYGIIEYSKDNFKLIKCGAITSGPKEEFGQRLNIIHQELTAIIKKYHPDSIGVEQLFFAKNAKTALKVSEARGVIMLTCWQHKYKVKEFTPLQVKQALTGYGLAPKIQIQKMVKVILRLKTTPKPDDVADALAVAICSAQTKDFK